MLGVNSASEGFEMPVWLFVCVLLAFTAAPANASMNMSYAGAGLQSCEEFSERYRAAPRETENFYFSWAQGFMSGRNRELQNLSMQGNHQLIRDLDSMETEAQKLFIRRYCSENPLRIYVGAVENLYLLLKQIEPF